MIKELDFKNKNGELSNWRELKKVLERNLYTIKEGRKGNERYSIVDIYFPETLICENEEDYEFQMELKELELNKLEINNRDGVLDSKWLNIELDNEMKEELIKELQWKRTKERLIKWKGVREKLEENGYVIEDRRVRKNKKQISVSIIHKE